MIILESEETYAYVQQVLGRQGPQNALRVLCRVGLAPARRVAAEEPADREQADPGDHSPRSARSGDRHRGGEDDRGRKRALTTKYETSPDWARC